MSSETKTPFQVDEQEFIIVRPNEMFVVVPYLGGTYVPTEENTVESSFIMAP